MDRTDRKQLASKITRIRSGIDHSWLDLDRFADVLHRASAGAMPLSSVEQGILIGCIQIASAELEYRRLRLMAVEDDYTNREDAEK